MVAEAERLSWTKGFWNRWVGKPIRRELTRGSSPESLAKAVSVAIASGVFPILGTTTVIGFVAGLAISLNQPVLHSIRVLCYPLHILMILPFIRLGEKIAGADQVSFSIPKMLAIFKDSPAEFGSLYGMTCLHGIVAWLLCLPFIVVTVYAVSLPLLKKFRAKI